MPKITQEPPSLNTEPHFDNKKISIITKAVIKQNKEKVEIRRKNDSPFDWHTHNQWNER